jgi:hypothetical protein
VEGTTAFYLVLAVVAAGAATYSLFRHRAAKKGDRSVTEGSRVLRVVLAFLLLGASAWVTMTASPNLGLDLEGGAQITLEAQDAPNVEASAENTDRAVEVLRRRVDALGVSEPSLSRSGENRIIVELPGVEDPTEASEALGQTAQLTFHLEVCVDPLTDPGDLFIGEILDPRRGRYVGLGADLRCLRGERHTLWPPHSVSQGVHGRDRVTRSTSR